MRFLRTALLTFAFGVTSQCFAQQSNSTWCTPQETTVFNCSIGKKVLSICSSSQLTKTSGEMQYRFGHLHSPPELAVPKQPQHPSKFLEISTGHLFASGAHEMFYLFEFENNKVLYQLHWQESDSSPNGKADLTISGSAKKAQTSTLKCASRSIFIDTKHIEPIITTHF
ncbi:hypothetical protein ABT392_14510 [Paucibacter sp. JuS9]|uniref:hypothetical protein n=1 Tax=Paucibacter sp. JuS9 TaxID=3228748 RepID=UPI003757F200